MQIHYVNYVARSEVHANLISKVRGKISKKKVQTSLQGTAKRKENNTNEYMFIYKKP